MNMNLYFCTDAVPFSRAQYGQGRWNQAILLDDVGCLGTEDRLVDCRHSPIGIHNCTHSADAGVRCSTEGSCKYENKHTLFLMLM